MQTFKQRGENVYLFLTFILSLHWLTASTNVTGVSAIPSAAAMHFSINQAVNQSNQSIDFYTLYFISTCVLKHLMESRVTAHDLHASS